MEDLNDKINGNTLQATEWNQVPSELQNIIEALGQTLSAANLNQLGIGIAGYVANGNFYTDSGSADAYNVSTVGSKQSPFSYTDGMIVHFVPDNTNTGASTVDIAGLGVKDIKFNGADPAADMIRAGVLITLKFNSVTDDFDIIYNQEESGSWTPELWDASLSGAEGQTYSIQVGRYKKTGSMVFFEGRLAATALGTLAGSVFIGNLPFTPRTVSSMITPITISTASNLAITAGESVGGRIDSGENYIRLELSDQATGITALQFTELTNTAGFAFSGWYTIN